MIKLIVGLGNKGEAYTRTHHNAGFRAVDRLLREHEHDTIPMPPLLKNDGFMNESGIFVAAAVRRARIATEELLVIHDESDLPLGAFRFSFDRGAAGHRGVASIIQKLGTKKFWRLRLGIRPTGNDTLAETRGGPNRKKAGSPAEIHRAKAGAFVLHSLSRAAEQELMGALERALPELKRLLTLPHSKIRI